VRNLVRDSFMAGEIPRFCRDHPLLAPVLTHLGAKFSHEEVNDVLVEYCQTRLLFPELVEAIHEANPRQYEKHFVCANNPDQAQGRVNRTAYGRSQGRKAMEISFAVEVDEGGKRCWTVRLAGW
jgi:hypothetical protein